MARTVNEIQNQILDQIKSEIPQLNSTSKTAIYRLFSYIIACSIYLFEIILDNHKKDVDKIIEENKIGRIPWYVKLVKDFQLDTEIFIIDGIPKYKIIDEKKKIVKKVAIVEQEEKLKIKLAKTKDKKLVPLSETELLQLENYLDKTRIAGTSIELVSLNADKLYYEIDIYFDAIFNSDDVKNRLLDRMNLFRDNDSFDSVFKRHEFLSQILETEAVVDCKIRVLKAKQGEDIESIDLVYDVKAGYFNWDENSSINMINSNLL
ncbi:MAG: hypothetical protein N4A49_06760 [Marinifilaceae bacterium]|jgi:hypothetical protein|nr:hypothetical protein [Marinifilaceae bacterium]